MSGSINLGVAIVRGVTNFLRADVSNLKLASGDAYNVFHIYSDSDDWTMEYNNTWSDGSGDTYRIEADKKIGASVIRVYSMENENFDRESSVTFRNSKHELTIPIIQLGRYDEFMTADGDWVQVSNGEKFITIK